MIEMKNFKDLEEVKKALYALKLFGLDAHGMYAGETYSTIEVKVNGVGAELSKDEYKKVLLERAEKLSLYQQEEIQKKKEALKKVPYWVEKASEYLDPQRLSMFLDYIMKSIDGQYHGQDVEDALDVFEFVKNNTGDNYDVMQVIKKKETPYLVLVKLIDEYFSRGFYTSMEVVREAQYITK